MRFKGLLLLLLFGLSFGEDAKSLWQRVKSKYGTKEGLRQNAEVPLKTDTPMTNVEGSKSFNARIQCPSKREGVRITFLPLSGNEYRLLIEQDLNLDGKMEYRYDSYPIKVSGVCHSGIVSCESGWRNCRFYYWDAPNGYVRLVETNDTSLLGGCFCSNSSCGVNSLAGEIVDFVAGGVAQAIMRSKENLSVSKASFDLTNMSVSLYVQDKSGCSYGNFPIFGEKNPTQYYHTQRPPDGQSYVLYNPEVQSNPYSPYYLTSKASEVKIEGKSISYPRRFSCDVRKDVFIQTTTAYENCSQTWTDRNGETWCIVADFFKDRGGSHCGGNACRDCSPFSQGPHEATVVLRYQQKYAIYVANWLPGGDRGGYWYYAWMVDGRWEQGGGNTGAPNCGRFFEFFRILGVASQDGETHTVGARQEQHSWGKNHSYPSRFGRIMILKSKEYKEDNLSLTQSNTCNASDGCVIKNEWICDKDGKNCIQTIREGVRTGARVFPFCYTTNTQIRNYTVCAYGDRIEVRGNPSFRQVFNGSEMWFWVKREYECPSQELSLDLSRAQSVMESVSYSSSSGVITYRDFGKTYGIWVGTPEGCPVATCVVKTYSQDTSVFADRTNRAQTPGGATTTPMEVRSCQKGTSGWVCPVSSGEEIKENCKCQMGLDGVGFSYTISVLQGVVEASRDLICSSVGP